MLSVFPRSASPTDLRHCQLLQSTLAVLAANQAYAAPEQPRATALAVSDSKKLVIIKTEETPGGTFEYYGLVGGGETAATKVTPTLDRRCGADYVQCAGVNVPNADPCGALIYNGLQYNNSILPDWVRAICLTTHGQCCISWAAPTFNLPYSVLFNAAVPSFGACVVHGASGLTRDTNLNGVCTDQCLSNRPDGCA